MYQKKVEDLSPQALLRMNVPCLPTYIPDDVKDAYEDYKHEYDS